MRRRRTGVSCSRRPGTAGSAAMTSRTLHRERLSELVIAAIKTYILEHSLGEGDRLPTEQQMAELFGVSRVSIREATKALGFLGIIRAAPRRGLTVGQVDMRRVTEYLGFHFALSRYPREQLLKTRAAIETGALPEAMEHITADDGAYATLLAVSRKLEQARSNEEFIAADLEFHRTILEISGIEPLLAFNGLLDVFFKRFREQVVKAIRVREQRLRGPSGHTKILAALRSQDLPRAQQLLRDHLAHYRGHV